MRRAPGKQLRVKRPAVPDQHAEPPPEPATKAAVVRFSRRAILSFAAIFAAAVAFAILLTLVKAKSADVLRIDNSTADELHEFLRSHRTFAATMRVVSDLGSSLAWWIILVPVIGWLAYRRLPRLAAFVAVTAIGSSLLNTAIKSAVDRARPHLADPIATASGTSFPSGHAQAAIVGYGILVLVFIPVLPRRTRPWVIAAASLPILLIGFSRIALGVHYLSDVIAGFLIGAAWLLAMTIAFSAWRTDEGKPPVHLTDGLEPEQQQRITPGPTDSATPQDAPHTTRSDDPS